jgi:multiple sugar transport system permease protein
MIASRRKQDSLAGIRIGTRFKFPVRKVVLFIAALAFGFWILFPFYWMVISSFMTPAELGAVPPHWIPRNPTIKNYLEVTTGRVEDESGAKAYGSAREGQRFPRGLANSFLIGLIVAAYNLVVGTLAGYSYARFRFVGGTASYLLFLGSRGLPTMALIVPMFIIFRNLDLINTRWALIISYNVFTLPMTIWVLKEYFSTIPIDLEEMAMIDGATRLRAFFSVVLPISGPGLTAAGLMAFMESWSEFFYALSLTNELTFPPLLAGFQRLEQVNWNALAAAAVLGVIPPVILTLIFQRYLVAGLSRGAVKE